MDIKKIFNIILLALSLSTIFITLISYIVFKLRQAASAKIGKDEYDLEGTYFRRYAPELKKINKIKQEEALQKQQDPKRKIYKFASMGAFVFFVIFTIFMMEDYFKYRAQIEDKITTAEEFKRLIAQGLLARNEFNPYYGPVAIEEDISFSSKEQFASVLSELQKESFCLSSTWRTNKFNQDFHLQAKSVWEDFFKRNNLSYKVYKSLNSKIKCHWVLPHHASLSGSEWKILKNIMQTNLVIFTGNSLFYNGVGKQNSTDRFYELFGHSIKSTDKVLASKINPEKGLFTEIPSGHLIDWHPIDKNSSHIKTNSIASLIPANFENQRLGQNTKDYYSYIAQAENTVWLGLDPISGAGIDQYYSDLTLLVLINKNLSRPIVKISDLKDKTKSRISLVLNVDDPKVRLDPILEELNDFNIDYSLVANGDILNSIEDRDLFKYIKDSLVINDSETDIDKLNLKETFDLVQSERFNVEEVLKKKVTGLLPLNEEFDKKLLTAIGMDNYDYVFGGKKIDSNSPVKLKGGDMLYLPRSSKNSDAINTDPLMVNPDDIYDFLKSEYSQNKNFNAPYILSVSNSGYDNNIFKNALIRFIKNNKNKFSTLSSLMNWYQVKNKISVKTKLSRGKWIIVLENKSSENTGPFNLLVSYKGKDDVIKIESIKSQEKLEKSL
jgi:hypothetical protein